jgi:hypothetical protein
MVDRTLVSDRIQDAAIVLELCAAMLHAQNFMVCTAA